MEGFDDSMGAQTKGMYEAPTAVKLADGRWCLFADFYGAGCAGQGYVPFVSDDLTKGVFTRADEASIFPTALSTARFCRLRRRSTSGCWRATGQTCRTCGKPLYFAGF